MCHSEWGVEWKAGSPPKVAPQIFALRHLAIETYPLHPPFSLLPPVTPPFCGEAARAAAVGQARRQNPRQKKSFPSPCQRSRKFNSLERLGFAFLKPLRVPRGRRARHRCKEKIESCQMIFVLSNDLGGRNPQNSCERSLQTSRSRCYIFITFLFPGLTWQDFNCLHFRVESRMSRVRAPRLLREGCGKSNTSAQRNLINT